MQSNYIGITIFVKVHGASVHRRMRPSEAVDGLSLPYGWQKPTLPALWQEDIYV